MLGRLYLSVQGNLISRLAPKNYTKYMTEANVTHHVYTFNKKRPFFHRIIEHAMRTLLL